MYETPFSQLPFTFEWKNQEEAVKQTNRRPDGVEWNLIKHMVLFLEFTRCMDHPNTITAALASKSKQYDKAVEGLYQAQDCLQPPQHTVINVQTLPMVFGVRGAVAYTEVRESLKWFKLSQTKIGKVLAKWVREAMTRVSELCTAQFKALCKVPAAL